MSKILKQLLLSASCLAVLLTAPACCSRCKKHKNEGKSKSHRHGRKNSKSDHKEY